MNRLLLLLLFNTCTISVLAQAPYAGGEGDGYASASMSVVISSVNELENGLPEVRIFPNPARGFEHFSIEINTLNNEAVLLEIMNLAGQAVWQKRTDVPVIKTQLPPGFYFISIKTKEGEIQKKLVVVGS
ncbi:MAG: T9SS type A sorting domain-containing protein [Bacteroidia bacterium]